MDKHELIFNLSLEAFYDIWVCQGNTNTHTPKKKKKKQNLKLFLTWIQ